MACVNTTAIGFTLFPNLVGISSGLICRNETKELFQKLKMPSWRPPRWVFAPVWTSLYTSMGYASYLVYRDGGGFSGAARLPLTIYGANLLANWTWSPLFFRAQRFGLAFGVAHIINVTAVGMAFHFYEINPIAGYLIVPYCMWLCVATALGYAIYRDNKDLPKINEAKSD